MNLLTPSARGGWRVALRLARREALRRKAQTALMLVLICLPVLAVTAAAVVWRTSDVSSAESVDRRMGSADALVEATDTTRVAQAFDPVEATAWLGDVRARPASVADVRAVLGGDRPVTAIGRDSLSFETENGIGGADVVEADLGDPLTEGLFRPVEGSYPPGPGEAVVNPTLAERGPTIGDTLVVLRKTDDGERRFELEVVGIAESTTTRGQAVAAVAPGSIGKGSAQTRRWLVGGGPVTWADVLALNEVGVLATSRQVLTDPPPDDALPVEVRGLEEPVDDVTLTVLALVVAMVLIEVVLLAGPAFAVRAKAQAHALALVAAAGGTPRQARRTVLASGVVVGAVGGVVGVLLGILVGRLAVPVAQRLDGTWFGPFDVPWALLALVAGFGLLSAVLAAVVPAVSASRQDVVAVLAGRRGEGRPSRRSPVLGLVLLGVGTVAAAAGATQRGSAPTLIAGAAVISVVGMILLVPVAVALVARLAGRLPLVLRFAARDAARHRTRTVPAVAAVGATVAGVVALGIAVASQDAANEKSYAPKLPAGYGSVTFAPDADAGAVTDVLERHLVDPEVTPVSGVRLDHSDDSWTELAFRADGEDIGLDHWGSLGSPYLVDVGLPSYLEVSAGDRRRAEEALARDGMVLVRGSSAARAPEEVTVVAQQYGAETGDLARTARVRAVAATVLVDAHTPPVAAVLSPAVTEALRMPSGTVGLVVPGPISEDAEKDISESLAALPGAGFLYVERGFQPDPAVRIIQLVLAVLGGVLMLGGTLTATFLALSDARPDLATMAAVGARPRTRRGLAASYALVVGFVGAALGAPVGFIPGLAVSRPLTRQWPDTDVTTLDIPWLLVGAVVVGLPLLTAGAVGACARSRLPLTARID